MGVKRLCLVGDYMARTREQSDCGMHVGIG